MRVQHLIQTRFSVRSRWGYMDTFPVDWLRERLALFDAYCLPSFAAQTAEGFEWLLYCDETTDADVMTALRDRQRAVPQLRIVTTNADVYPIPATQGIIDETTEVLITTRVDSDDGIHREYIAATQAHAAGFFLSGRQSMLLNFPRGYKLDHDRQRLFLDWMPHSAFHSLFERHPNGSKTVLIGDHTTFHAEHPTIQDDSIPGWLQVIHSGNVLNRLNSANPEAGIERLRMAFR